MKKAVGVYRWMGERYKVYDELNGEYTGDKYSDIIFDEAIYKFYLTENEVDKMYGHHMEYMLEQLDEFAENVNEKTSTPMLSRATEIHNKQVKLNLNTLLKQKDKRKRNFVEFVNSNENMVFKAVAASEKTPLYKLHGNEEWFFTQSELFTEEFEQERNRMAEELKKKRPIEDSATEENDSKE